MHLRACSRTQWRVSLDACNFQTFVALLIRIRWPLEELDGANHQALPCRFHNLPRNLCQGIDFH